METQHHQEPAMKDRYDDLHLQEDPYLIECARWRAVLENAPASRLPRIQRRARWPHWVLAVGLGAALGVLLALW